MRRRLSQFFTLLIFFLPGACEYNDRHRGFSQLEQIRAEGVLRVLTRLDPTTYYESSEGFTGLEYDLAMLFAKHLKVRAEFIIPESFDEILSAIAENKADIAAAGLTVTEQRKSLMRFAPAYQTITEQIVYKSDRRRPKKISDLSRGILEIVKGSTHHESLQLLQQNNPKLEWNLNQELGSDGLLYLVNEGLIDYTVADSHQASIIKGFYPELNIAFDISQPRQLAWALPISEDDSLYQEVVLFFDQIKKNNILNELLEKHYGHANNLNYVGNCTFRKHIKERLPKYQQLFQKAADKHQLDWRLLAAIGYQESHWNKKAVSPTGVKGLMMLTKATAKQLKISNRIDPAQSIKGGALYFKQRLKKIPARIPEPDRTWMALASYNVGFGHLEDARVLTQKRGGNPDKWMDVKKNLPLLSVKRWYKQTKHGYARGKEPVRYVENIRSYYDLLSWLTNDDQIEKKVMAATPQSLAKPAISINVNNSAL